MKEQATEGEKILSAKKHISNIGLVCRIDKECSKLDIKKIIKLDTGQKTLEIFHWRGYIIGKWAYEEMFNITIH